MLRTRKLLAGLTRKLTAGTTLSHPMGEGASLGRETKGEVVLMSRLHAALERLNPALPPEAITAAVDDLTRDCSAMSLLSGQGNSKTN